MTNVSLIMSLEQKSRDHQNYSGVIVWKCLHNFVPIRLVDVEVFNRLWKTSTSKVHLLLKHAFVETKVFMHDQRTPKAKSRNLKHFFTLSVPCHCKQLRHCTGVKQLSQPVTQIQIQAKWISQVNAKPAQSMAMKYCCAEVPVSGCTTAWQCVCGRIRHASLPLALFFHSWAIKGGSVRWQTKRMWTCWKSEQVGCELNVSSVGLKWKKCHYFLRGAAVESKCLPPLI